MNIKRFLTSISVTIIALFLMTGLAFAKPSEDRASFGTSFTYQGQLKNGGTPYNGFCDFQFALFDALSGGSQVGTTLYPAAAVTGGYFTVTLDFGSGAFNGASRWLEIWVTCPSGSGSFTQLNPRQAITAAPYAIYANQAATANSAGSVPWSGISDVPAGFADGIDNDTTYTAGTGLNLAAGSFSADTAYLQRRVNPCGAGYAIQSVAMDGSVTCVLVSGGAGDITGVTAGTGLTGGGTEGNVTLSADTTYLQRRVSTACTAGSSIRAIAEDGTITCETDDNTTYMAGNGLTLDGTSFVVDKTITQMRVSNECAVGSAIRAISDSGTVTCQAVSGSAGWSLIGNAGTNPATNYIGTSDNQPLEIKVNALRVFRFEPNATSPNLIGGYFGNWVSTEVNGATIGGGGSATYFNRVTDTFGTVAGGQDNQAGNNSGNFIDAAWATIGGGYSNNASGLGSTIAGGYDNTISGGNSSIGGGITNSVTSSNATIAGGNSNIASGWFSTVGGGFSNDASSESATVAGGNNNTASGTGSFVGAGYDNIASGLHAAVCGGNLNDAAGMYSFVGGGYNNHINVDGWNATVAGGNLNTANGNSAAVGGGLSNDATGDNSTIAGGSQNEATGTNSAVGGGNLNTATALGATVGGGSTNTAVSYATVAGGNGNTAEGIYATVGGGWLNTVGGLHATIGGGFSNDASAESATIAGGNDNTASGTESFVGAGMYNIASGYRAAVCGGYSNDAAGNYSVVGGGYDNHINVDGFNATVAGGNMNRANASGATVGGGYSNDATGDNSIIAGGSQNEATMPYSTVGGGVFNEASGEDATVGGGYDNTASGIASTIPGGLLNQAIGNFSFVAGRGGIAYNAGCFVWSDWNPGSTLACGSDNTWVTRATGGYYLYTSTTGTGALLASGSGSWSSLSDKNMKSNLSSVDTRAVLEQVANMPISTWNYTAQDESIRHIGPMAQDFYAAFGVGEDDKHITTIDADGVALAAIQGLYSENQDLKTEVGTLKQEVLTLQQQNDAIESRLTALEQGGVTVVKSNLSSSLPWVLVVAMAVFGSGWVLRRKPGGEK